MWAYARIYKVVAQIGWITITRFACDIPVNIGWVAERLHAARSAWRPVALDHDRNEDGCRYVFEHRNDLRYAP